MGKTAKRVGLGLATGGFSELAGGFGGGTQQRNQPISSTTLTPQGQGQFDFVDRALRGEAGRGPSSLGIDAIRQGILRNTDPSAGRASFLSALTPQTSASDIIKGTLGFSDPSAGRNQFFDQLRNTSQLTSGGGLFNQATPSVGFNSGGLQSAINNLQGFRPSGAATGALDRLSGFSGTSAAKNALNQVGAFKGTPEAFRTLRALEEFGQAEQGFVTDARNAVLSFDEGFQSQALPLLQQAAEGQFLTEQAGNPFIRDLIDVAQRPVIENFNEQVLPGILSTFAGTGGVGSSLRGGFTNQQARDLQRNLGDISTTIGFNVFESERNKQLAAQQAILGFEDQGLNRQLAARTTNLQGTLESSRQLLAARTAAGSQATNLSNQRLQALAAQAQGQVSLSAQRQASLAAAAAGQVNLSGQRLSALQAALGGQSSLAGLNLSASQANAALKNDRINQLLNFQRNAAGAGSVQSQVQQRAI